jgi:2-methylisocitrate lyase-like PEP mutase family enzyme
MSIAQNESTARFRALHAPGNLLVLPNAWDVASARIAEDLGAKAIATSSAAVAWANGYSDGETLPKSRLLGLVADIVRIVRLPVSADSEAGYDASPETVGAFVAALARAGAVGVNLEDGTEPPSSLVAKIAAIKKACAHEGFDVFVNARTDVYLKSLVPPERALDETLSRGRLYRGAGADGFFVPALIDAAVMRKVVEAIDLPLNVLTFGGLPQAAELKRAGVRRLSAGAAPARAAYGAMRRAARELLDEGRYDVLNAEAEGLPNLNPLMKRE